MAAGVAPDRAYRAVETLVQLGGSAHLGEMIRPMGYTRSPQAAEVVRAAAELGWIERRGLARSKKASWHLTTGGHAEYARRHLKQPMSVDDAMAVAAAGVVAPDATVTIAIPADEVSRFTGKGEAKVVAGILNGEARARRDEQQQSSLRTRIMQALVVERSWESMDQLMAMVREPGEPTSNFGMHEFSHILQSLNRQGLVTYVDARNGKARTFTRIRATAALYREMGVGQQMTVEVGATRRLRSSGQHAITATPEHKGDRTDFRTHGAKTTGGPIERVKAFTHEAGETIEPKPDLDDIDVGQQVTMVVEPEPEELTTQPVAGEPLVAVATVIRPAYDQPSLDLTERFPLLRELRARAEARAAHDGLASRLLEAAALLESVAPEESARLIAQAQVAEGEPFTSLETEYLRFAEETIG